MNEEGMASTQSVEDKEPQKTTLTTLLQQLDEIENIIYATKNKLQFACDEPEPKETDNEVPISTVSLSALQHRIQSIARIASETAKLTSNLLG